MSSTRIFWTTVVALVVFNIARGLGLFGPLADAVELVLALALTAVALRGALTKADIGLERSRVGSGLKWGGAAFALVFIVVAIAGVIPATSGFLHDSRGDVPLWRLLLDLVWIALLTVIPEELLFRGLLLGAAMKKWGTGIGVVVTSVLFGFWHIFPTLSTAGGNEKFSQADSSTLGRIGLVAGAVVTTTIAGLIFSWLRVRSRSLVAPMLAHLGTNGIALTVAWFVVR